MLYNAVKTAIRQWAYVQANNRWQNIKTCRQAKLMIQGHKVTGGNFDIFEPLIIWILLLIYYLRSELVGATSSVVMNIYSQISRMVCLLTILISVY